MSTVQSAEFDFFSVPEAADALGVTDGRIRQMLAAGELRGHKLGEKNWAIPKAEVDKQKALPRSKVGRPRTGDQ